jgi:hypothetical protein
MRFPLSGLLGLLALSPAAALASPVYFAIQTDITGAQTQIDATHSTTWTISTGAAWSFGGGTFTMKEGSNATAPVRLSVYEGTNFTGRLVANIELTNAAFCAQVANCQQFNEIDFLFGTPATLDAYKTYFLNLTSAANDRANQQYFIKGASAALNFVDATGVTIPAGYFQMGSLPPITPPPGDPAGPSDPNSPSGPTGSGGSTTSGGSTGSGGSTSTGFPPPAVVPAPGALGLFAFGLLALGATRLRRRGATA